MLIYAADKKTLDAAINLAMQKELIEKSKNVKNCTICGLNNHDESTCRRKKNENNDKKPNQNKPSNWNKNNFRKNRDQDNKNRGESSNSQAQNDSPNRSPQKDFTGWKNQNFKSNNNNNQQRNVKTTQEDEFDDDITVRELLDEFDESKN